MGRLSSFGAGAPRTVRRLRELPFGRCGDTGTEFRDGRRGRENPVVPTIGRNGGRANNRPGRAASRRHRDHTNTESARNRGQTSLSWVYAVQPKTHAGGRYWRILNCVAF